VGIVNLGVDLGQRRDPTVVAVVELDWRPTSVPRRADPHHTTRFLERLPLGTPYPAVTIRLAQFVRNLERVLRQEATDRSPDGPGPSTLGRLYLDATGLGTPVLDLLQLPIVIGGCYFTHGDRRTEDRDGITIGKAWLVSRMQVLLQGGRLHLPKTAEAEVLGRELLDYEICVDQGRQRSLWRLQGGHPR
jgi:hypothetical protein